LFQADRKFYRRKIAERNRAERRRKESGSIEPIENRFRSALDPVRVASVRDATSGGELLFPLGTYDNIMDICHFNRVTSRILPF
jgi:hypothetical protein